MALKTITKSGKPPSSRIDEAAMAASLVTVYRNAEDTRASKRAIIKGLIDGNAPYNAAELKRMGQSYRSNVNFREAEGHLAARATTYSNLILDVSCLVSMTIKDKEFSTTDYAGKIAGHFHDMLMKWPGFMFNMLLHQKELVDWGAGPVYWPHKRGWKFKALKRGSFLVANAADATLDTISVVVIRGQYDACELFYKISASQEELDAKITDKEKQEAAKEQGWNVSLAKKLIIDADKMNTAKTQDQYSTSQWESLQQQIKNSDTMYSSSFSETIPVAHVFVKEYRGEISHFIIPESTDGSEFLFEKRKEYDCFENIICLFLADIGDGSFHSIKGMGAKIYAHCVVNNRMKNTLVDAAGLGASMVIQGDLSSARMIRLGPVALIQNGVSVIAGAFNPNLDGLLKVSAKLESNLSKNVGTERPDLLDHPEDKNQTQIGERARMYREGKLERTDIMFYYQQADMLYNEIWRRLTNTDYSETDPGWKERKAFFEACKDDGIPKELLDPEKVSIEATRALGLGSPIMAREIGEAIVSLAPYFPDSGKNNAIRDLLAIMAGWKRVDRYMPSINTNSVPSNEHSIAQLENNDLQSGEQALVGQDQSGIIHLMVHLSPLVAIAEQFIATGGVGDNPMKVHDYFLAALHHCAQHLDLMKDDKARSGEYKQFMAQFDDLLKVYNKLDAMVKKLQAQLQAQKEQEMADMQARSQQNPELAAKLAKQRDDFQLGIMKEQNMQKIRTAKASQIMNINAAKAVQKLGE